MADGERGGVKINVPAVVTGIVTAGIMLAATRLLNRGDSQQQLAVRVTALEVASQAHKEADDRFQLQVLEEMREIKGIVRRVEDRMNERPDGRRAEAHPR